MKQHSEAVSKKVIRGALGKTDVESEIETIKSALKDHAERMTTLQEQLKGLSVYFESLFKPGAFTVEAVSDDLETLGEALGCHTHNENGAPVIPISMLRKGKRIR